jgi:hypothetical protein
MESLKNGSFFRPEVLWFARTKERNGYIYGYFCYRPEDIF